MAKKNKNKATEKKPDFSPSIKNKKVRFNFNILEKFEAGIKLVGTEVKSIRKGQANLEEAFARFDNGELFLYGCNINKYEYGNMRNHEPLRTRKLLLHRRELLKIQQKVKQQGITIVPTRFYFLRGMIKVEIATATGKSLHDKRDKLRDRQMKMDVAREMKRY